MKTAYTQSERLALIKEISDRKNRIANIVAKGENVRSYVEDEYEAPVRVNLTNKYDGESEIHYTDAPKYVNEHYGDRARAQSDYESAEGWN